jgi:hypothetical protein
VRSNRERLEAKHARAAFDVSMVALNFSSDGLS